MNNQKKFISVIGNIGVGKTTLAELLTKKFNLEIFYEKVIDNPYLHDYYADMKKWSFHLQVYFFNHRFKEQLVIKNSNKSCIQDRSIYEDPKVFAYVLHKQGNLSDLDYETYLNLFSNLVPFLPEPDLFIYLKASTWTLISRIRKRGRKFEMGITPEFLHELNLAYDRWIPELSKTQNVLIIDTDKFNIETDHRRLEQLYKSVEEKLTVIS